VEIQEGAGAGTVDTSGTPTTGQAAEFTDANTIQGVGTTGSGNYVKATSAALVTPALGTPTALVLTNATGLTSAGIVDETIDETDLDTSVNASLDLADSATQPGDNISTLTNDLGFITSETDDQTAAEVTYSNTGSGLTAADVQAAIDEQQVAIDLNSAKVTNADHDGDVWGDQTLTIQPEAVEESMLNMFNAPTDEYLLGYDSTNGLEWRAAMQPYPGSPTVYTQIYGGTVAQITAASLPANVLAIPSDASNDLDDIDDVTITSPATGTTLVWNGSAWIDGTLGTEGITDDTITMADIDLDGAIPTNNDELYFIAGATGKIGTRGQDASFVIALSNTTTAITTGTAKETIRFPWALNITGVYASVATESSSGVITIGINENGTSITSTDLTIDANEKGSDTAATAAVISDATIAQYGELTFDIDTAGTGAVGLKLYVTARK
jgi:hypothetical protein